MFRRDSTGSGRTSRASRGANTGRQANLGPGWTTINLASGQELGGIDMRLHPLARVTQMNEEVLFKLYPDAEISIFGGGSDGRFSPGGRFLAFTTFAGNGVGVQVWTYDLRSERLTPAIVGAQGLPGVNIGWVGGTLYADYSNNVQFAKFNTDNGPGPDILFAATARGTREIQALPRAAREALREDQMHQTGVASNGRFAVSAAHQTCFRCTEFDLTARPADGGKPYVIASGSGELGSFIFEPDRSLVLYPTMGFPYTIVTYDLNTRQKYLTYLPNGAQLLLDATPESGGYLVAYISNGPCQGYASGTGFYPWPVPAVRAPNNVCFAKVPWGAKK
jgi:hypothetical protein